MSKSRDPITRRTFLRGAGGVALSLPLLECMGATLYGQGAPGAGAEIPKRFLGLYVGHGVSVTTLGDNGSEIRKWGWYPIVNKETGKMKFGESMRGFNAFADRCSIIYGLEHPRVIKSNGHGTADSFLTGSHIEDAVKSPSLDQVAAARHGHKTRFPSLVLSCEGGLGSKGVSKTMSYDSFGRAIPASNDLRYLFNRLFNNDPALKRQDLRRISSGKRMVDLVLESYKELQRELGSADSQKMEQYFDTLNAVDQDIERMEGWVDTPKPDVGGEDAFNVQDPETQNPIMSLQATVNEPAVYIRTMYNLVYLAFKTGSTRYATFQLLSMGGGAWGNICQQHLGLEAGHHGLAHQWEHRGFNAPKNSGGIPGLAKYDQFQSNLMTEFIKKLGDTPEGEGNMLDHTMVLYGTSNSKTHSNTNYPLLVCGGEKLGLKQGKFHNVAGGRKVPLNNLYVRLLEALDVPVDRFSDSTGKLEGTI
jgi:hypothetical protein